MTDPTNDDLLASDPVDESAADAAEAAAMDKAAEALELAPDPVVDAVAAALADEDEAYAALEKAEADLAAANALPPPSTSPPPVDNNVAPKPLPVITATESPVVPVERWRACTGQDISAVLRARSMGLAEFTTRDEVFSFLASKGG